MHSSQASVATVQPAKGWQASARPLLRSSGLSVPVCKPGRTTHAPQETAIGHGRVRQVQARSEDTNGEADWERIAAYCRAKCAADRSTLLLRRCRNGLAVTPLACTCTVYGRSRLPPLFALGVGLDCVGLGRCAENQPLGHAELHATVDFAIFAPLDGRAVGSQAQPVRTPAGGAR
jgi:hypothetical protein